MGLYGHGLRPSLLPPQIVEASKSQGERSLQEKQEKVQIEIEKCHRRAEEFSEYSDLTLMQQYCKDVAK